MLRTATDSPGVYFIHSDHLNTPTWVSNPWGSAVWAADYSPFGQAAITNATLSFNLRLPGQYHDPETGLHYNWHRYYDPSTGRYITSDPIGLAGGLNTYAYVGGNPIMYADPAGLASEAVPLSRLVDIPKAHPIALMASLLIHPTQMGDGLLPRSGVVEKVEQLNKEGQDSKIIPWPPKTPGKWTCICRADANERSPDLICNFIKNFAFGWGVGSSMPEAYRMAENMAKLILSASSVHHVQCKCTGPKGEKINRGTG